MSNLRPTSKVGAAAAAGAGVTALILFAEWFGAPPAPAGLEGALVTLAAFVAGWLKTERSNDG